MIHFFRDILNGPLYIVVVILAVILIMAIIGFLMERKQLEQKKKEGIAVVDSVAIPDQPITTNKKEIEKVQVSSIPPETEEETESSQLEEKVESEENIISEEQITSAKPGKVYIFTDSESVDNDDTSN